MANALVTMATLISMSTSIGQVDALANKPCKADNPCNKPTLQECKNDLIQNVCPKPDRNCPVLYFDWNGKEYSVTCPAKSRLSQPISFN